MRRRDVIKAAVLGEAAVMLGPRVGLAERYDPVRVDENLWHGINQTKNPSQESTLDKLHSSVITAPGKVKAGEVFPVALLHQGRMQIQHGAGQRTEGQNRVTHRPNQMQSAWHLTKSHQHGNCVTRAGWVIG